MKPLSIGELLDRTFLLYRRHFVLFVGISALPNLVSLAFNLLWRVLGPGDIFLTFLSFLAVIFVYLVTTAFSQGATTVAVSQIQLGRPTNVSEAFERIRYRLGEFIFITLNMGVRILIGFFFFFIPGVLLALRYALTMPVAVLEGTGASDSLARSAELTAGDRGRIFLIYCILIALVLVVTLAWQAPVGLLVRIVYGTTTEAELPLLVQILLQFGTFVIQSIISPIVTIAMVLVYYDERVRKEAFDLEHMMQQLDAGAQGQGRPRPQGPQGA